MSKRLLVGTRKGLFRIERDRSGGWDISQTWFLGDPVSMLLPEAAGQRLHVALDLGHFGVKIHRSVDGGLSWSEAAVPVFPPKPDDFEDKDPMRGIDLPWSTQMIWALESGGPGELWCGVIPVDCFTPPMGVTTGN